MSVYTKYFKKDQKYLSSFDKSTLIFMIYETPCILKAAARQLQMLYNDIWKSSALSSQNYNFLSTSLIEKNAFSLGNQVLSFTTGATTPTTASRHVLCQGSLVEIMPKLKQNLAISQDHASCVHSITDIDTINSNHKYQLGYFLLNYIAPHFKINFYIYNIHMYKHIYAYIYAYTYIQCIHEI